MIEPRAGQHFLTGGPQRREGRGGVVAAPPRRRGKKKMYRVAYCFILCVCVCVYRLLHQHVLQPPAAHRAGAGGGGGVGSEESRSEEAGSRAGDPHGAGERQPLGRGEGPRRGLTSPQISPLSSSHRHSR